MSRRRVWEDSTAHSEVAPWPRGIGAITLFVEDLAAAKQFFQRCTRPQDLGALQALLDRSYLSAGDHLRSIHTESRRMSATARRLVHGVTDAPALQGPRH